MEWRIGCSGFYYKDWKDIFYPKGLAQKDWFKYYAEHFNTVEINSTFYKMATETTFNNWFAQSPADFIFTIKAPRLITHYKKFNDTTSLTADFYNRTQDGLKEKLGCVLFQMPPGFVYTKEHLDLILKNLDPKFTNIVEFRHISWWNPEVYRILAAHNITFCGQSYPSALPEDVIVNTATIYYRFHGKPILYKSQYPPEAIKMFFDAIDVSKNRCFVYFNNTWGVGALENARELKSLFHSVKS